MSENTEATTETPAAPPEKEIPAVIDMAIVPVGAEITTNRIQVTERGITFIGEPGYDFWFKLLTAWRRFPEIVHLGLADIITAGRSCFGDIVVAKDIEQLEFDLADATRGYKISSLPAALRELALTSEHFFVLGSMLSDEKLQVEWANIAVNEPLTAFELKKSIEAGKVVHMSEINTTSGRGSGIPNVQGLNLWYSRWIKQVGGVEKILAWPAEQKTAWLEEVRPIYELAKQVEASLPPVEQPQPELAPAQ